MSKKKAINLLQKIYNVCVILEAYCEKHNEEEITDYVMPILEYVKTTSNKTYTELQDLQEKDEISNE